MLRYQSQQFKLDNFDSLLLVQSMQHLRDAEADSEKLNTVLQKAWQCCQLADSQVLRSVPQMSIQEFVAIAKFYLENLDKGMKVLPTVMLRRIAT
jgi:hypothetical protein